MKRFDINKDSTKILQNVSSYFFIADIEGGLLPNQKTRIVMWLVLNFFLYFIMS